MNWTFAFFHRFPAYQKRLQNDKRHVLHCGVPVRPWLRRRGGLWQQQVCKKSTKCNERSPSFFLAFAWWMAIFSLFFLGDKGETRGCWLSKFSLAVICTPLTGVAAPWHFQRKEEGGSTEEIFIHLTEVSPNFGEKKIRPTHFFAEDWRILARL